MLVANYEKDIVGGIKEGLVSLINNTKDEVKLKTSSGNKYATRIFYRPSQVYASIIDSSYSFPNLVSPKQFIDTINRMLLSLPTIREIEDGKNIVQKEIIALASLNVPVFKEVVNKESDSTKFIADWMRSVSCRLTLKELEKQVSLARRSLTNSSE